MKPGAALEEWSQVCEYTDRGCDQGTTRDKKRGLRASRIAGGTGDKKPCRPKETERVRRDMRAPNDDDSAEREVVGQRDFPERMGDIARIRRGRSGGRGDAGDGFLGPHQRNGGHRDQGMDQSNGPRWRKLCTVQ